MFKRIVFLTAILLMVLFSPLSVLAIGGGGVAAYPTNPDPLNPVTRSWFIYGVEPGGSKEDSITLRNDSDEVNQYASVEVMDSELCPRFTAKVVKNVKIEPSPLWMQMRLMKAGMNHAWDDSVNGGIS